MWHEPLFTIHETPITLFNLLVFVAVVILTILIAKLVRTSVARLASLKGHVSPSTLYGLGRLAYYIVLILGFYIALTIVGVDLTGIAVVVGALSVGIGFGLQSIFNNFAAGIILLIERKVRVGDMVQLESGDIGHVQEINVRSTLIRTLDNRKILVPNTEIVSKKLINWTLGSDNSHRFRIPFTIERDEDKEKIKAIALDVAAGFNSKGAAPEVWLTRIGEKNQDFELVLWMERKETDLTSQSMTARCLWSLDTAFAEKGIKLVEASRQIGKSSFLQEL